MDDRGLLIAKTLLSLFVIFTFVGYNFWELYKDGWRPPWSKDRKDDAESGQVSEPKGDGDDETR